MRQFVPFSALGFACLLAATAAGAQQLGPAPWLDAAQRDALVTPQPKAVQNVPPIDTTSQAAVRSAYNQYYNTTVPAMGWSGNVASCNAGTTSVAWQEWFVTRINFLRALAGVPGNLALNATNSANAQQAALMMSAQNNLSHAPPPTWACYTATGANAAANSNLALGGLTDFLPLYMDDPGIGNEITGHRRWILYTQEAQVGVGNIPPGGQPGSNALWVLTNFGPPISVPNGVTWPARGYFPTALFPPSKRWSFGYPNADFSSATVTMTANGSPLAVNIVSRSPPDSGYGDNTLVFEPTYTLANNVTYAVTINGVTGSAPSSFSYTVTSFDVAVTPPVTRGDVNLDGIGDVIWRDSSAGLVYEWQTNGLAVTNQGYLPTVPTNWAPVGIGDLNGDGRADVFWRDQSSGLDYLWMLNGLNITSQGYMPTVPAPWTVVGIGDFSGDGRADVLWRNPSTGQNYVWVTNGLTITDQGYAPTVSGTDWEPVAIGDFDGNGRADVFWRNKVTGQNYLWPMNSYTVTGAGFLPTVIPVDWEVVGAPDANGDGKADVLWRNKVTGQNYLWIMNGLTVTSQGYLPTVSDLNWKVVGYNDYDGDGRGDVLFRNAVTGQDYLWTLNGLTVVTQGYLPSVTGANWQPVK